jgi:hypothetical protein
MERGTAPIPGGALPWLHGISAISSAASEARERSAFLASGHCVAGSTEDCFPPSQRNWAGRSFVCAG